MRINNNLMAMNTHRQLAINNTSGAKSIEKLSSGYRINRAGDDAAGLAISEKMRGQIRGLNQASRNAQDDISLIQTTEGALNETHAIIQRMREMAVQSSNDTNTDEDRQALQNEMDQLAKEVTRISNTTEFNTRKLLNGNLDKSVVGSTGDLTFHIGANTDQNMKFAVKSMDAFTLGLAEKDVVGDVSGGKNITSVKVPEGSTGTSLVDGKKVVISTAVDTAATQINQTEQGVTFTTTGEQASLFNDYAITVDTTGSAASTVIDHDNKTIVVTTNGNAAVATGAAVSVVGTAPEGVTLTITGNTTGDGTAVLAGGVDADYAVTLNDGVNTLNITDVAKDAKKIVATGTHFAGLEINTNGTVSTETKGTVSFGQSAATTFSSAGVVDVEAKVTKGIDITTQSAANKAINTIDSALKAVSDERAKLGAVQNRLEHTIKNVDTSAENLQASESRIRDVDMAKEMMEFTKNNILQQAAQAMLAQANQAPQGVLQLLR